ncbi:MAG: hypothetical protein ACE5NA_12260, partial [Nitrospiraceae bacterium]
MCISGKVHDELRNRLDLSYEDLGEQTVKNIPEPVHAYAVHVRTEQPAPERRRPRWQIAFAAGAITAVIAAGFWATREAVPPPSPVVDEPEYVRPLRELFETEDEFIPAEWPDVDSSIAVLPFLPLGEEVTQHLADSIAMEVISQFTASEVVKVKNTYPMNQGDAFRVAPRRGSFRFRDGAESLATVGNELNVSYVLDGTVQKTDSDIRVTMQMTRVFDEASVWSASYTRS